MGSVIVGVDGSAMASAASRWAARLATASGAELVVASAWRSDQAEGTLEDVARQREAARALLEGEWCEPVRAMGVEPRPLLLDGPPDALLAAADEEHADLLVVGNRGIGGFASLHVGSVAHHLAHHTNRPLAIVPRSTAETLPQTIVVGIDRSPASEAAVAWCADFAPTLGARVVAVLAYEPFLQWVPANDPTSWRREAEHHLTERVAPLRSRGIQVDTRIVEDIHPVAAIANAAVDRSAQLVVVGTHEVSGLTKMRLDNACLQLVHHLGLPVVLVPTQPA